MAGAIFMGELDARCASEMMVYMLIFCCSWEYVTNKIEALVRALLGLCYTCVLVWPAETHVLQASANIAHKEMLTKVYKELMILGFIAFAVIMSKEFGIKVSAAKMHCFEFCDLLVTICVLLYVVTNVAASFSMHVTRREWDRISMMRSHDVVEKLNAYFKSQEGSTWAKFKHLLAWSEHYRDEADFKAVQMLFKSKFHLGRNFDYMQYVKYVLETNVVNLANISVYHWLTIICISLIINLGAEQLNEDAVASSSHRRQLGGAAAPEKCVRQIDCNMTVAQLQAEIDLLVGNSSSSYGAECSACEASRMASVVDEDTKLSFFIFLGFGYFLLLLQLWMLRTLGKRTHLVLKLHGAKNAKMLPALLSRLDAKFERYYHSANADRANMVDPDSDQTEDHMMVFHKSKKTANDVLSWRTFSALMFIVKWIQLLNAFYCGLYITHMHMRVSLVVWSDGNLAASLGHLLIHIAIVTPMLIVAFYGGAVSMRRISLLVGVLHLHDDAVVKVQHHMDVVTNIRNRIYKHLQTAKIIKGKPKPTEGEQLLKTSMNGEVQILKEMATMGKFETRASRTGAESLASYELDDEETQFANMMTRKQCEEMLAAKQAHTPVEHLREFLDRDSFAIYQTLPPGDKATCQTSATLKLGATEAEDTIRMWEFEIFLVRSIADVANVAEEHGTESGALVDFLKKVLSMCSTVTREDFERARMLARTKCLFRIVDGDSSGSITKSELHKSLRKFKIPISGAELQTILRVIDPDQSGAISESEWIDFMMSSEEDLDRQRQAAESAMAQANADKGHGVLTYTLEIANTIGVPMTSEQVLSQLKRPFVDPVGFLGIPDNKQGPSNDCDSWDDSRFASSVERFHLGDEHAGTQSIDGEVLNPVSESVNGSGPDGIEAT
jgi:Ca2+-binding EF-hand superfamily protein